MFCGVMSPSADRINLLRQSLVYDVVHMCLFMLRSSLDFRSDLRIFIICNKLFVIKV